MSIGFLWVATAQQWLNVGMTRALCLLMLVGCAGTPTPPRPLPPKPPERSSLDVLLRNRSELGLTDEQVAKLETMDEARETEVASLREQLQPKKKDDEGGGRPAPTGGMGAQPPPGMGNGMGAARGGGGRGMGRGGMGGGQGGSRAAADPDRLHRLRGKIDDADTRSFLEAQNDVLTERQREPAGKMASAYRAMLYDYNEALRARENAQ
jgi:hypothetical protein